MDPCLGDMDIAIHSQLKITFREIVFLKYLFQKDKEYHLEEEQHPHLQ